MWYPVSRCLVHWINSIRERGEVRSKIADSHLGHEFEDGPAPTYIRYCINSFAMRFIAKENMTKEGYGVFEYLFK